MRQKRITFIFLAVGLLFVVGSAAILMTTPAKAQCGSQASSCKNCHETQAQGPVNNDGTAWHTQHAFGDFCYLCHAGNNQATDKTAAHTGMVDPLSDIAADCKSCHPNDFTAKAQIYATTLGVMLGAGATSTGSTPTPAATPSSANSTPIAPQVAPSGMVGSSTDNVDYVQRYNQIVLGKTPVNVGNVILFILAAALLLGGGYFVVSREGWVKVSFAETKKIKEEYPADVVDMVPEIARLKPESRKSLHHLLGKTKTANEFLTSVDKLIQDNSTGESNQDNSTDKGV
jgi:hypothetical protein